MSRFVCELSQEQQDKIRDKVVTYLNGIKEGLAWELDDFGYTNVDNVMSDTISNLENMLHEEELE